MKPELIQWKTRKPLQQVIDELSRKYTPKQIGEYEENGVTIKVYETRNAEGL